MDRESSPSPLNQACASCKHQRKKCDSNCELAPYFPANKYHEFQNAHKLFGVSNILKIIASIEPHKRKAAAESILFEGNAWKSDPVHGCLGVIKDLTAQMSFHEKQLSVVNQHLAFHKEQQKKKQEQDQSDFLNDELPDLPDELMEDMKIFEHGHNYWSNLVGADGEKPFDMEHTEAFDKEVNPLTYFNGQAGECSTAAPKAEQCLEFVKKEKTEDEAIPSTTHKRDAHQE
ncbi:LOB domain-containing protein 22-like [Rosa rugosa]|uniref:LOB domain-containing protein 22-like n=1 Tax=Rosa rugosa TaxID=74645 RepID=UPI002B4077CD|nr:LOB domain-containing protein 22-like [Rosa rugosa]